MLIKSIIIVFLLVIIGSLFSALMFLFKDRNGSDRMVKALTVRISLSVCLFLIIMAGFYFDVLPLHRQ